MVSLQVVSKFGAQIEIVFAKSKRKDKVLGFAVFFFFFTVPVFFLHSCLSLEAETWRRTASPALSATEKHCVKDRRIAVYL